MLVFSGLCWIDNLPSSHHPRCREGHAEVVKMPKEATLTISLDLTLSLWAFLLFQKGYLWVSLSQGPLETMSLSRIEILLEQSSLIMTINFCSDFLKLYFVDYAIIVVPNFSLFIPLY